MDQKKLHENASEFFGGNGNAIMRLTPEAAAAVCIEAIARELVVIRIEGGIHRADGTFESRLDCIWDSPNDGSDHKRHDPNNQTAAEFVKRESANHNAFVITVARRRVTAN